MPATSPTCSSPLKASSSQSPALKPKASAAHVATTTRRRAPSDVRTMESTMLWRSRSWRLRRQEAGSACCNNSSDTPSITKGTLPNTPSLSAERESENPSPKAKWPEKPRARPISAASPKAVTCAKTIKSTRRADKDASVANPASKHPPDGMQLLQADRPGLRWQLALKPSPQRKPARGNSRGAAKARRDKANRSVQSVVAEAAAATTKASEAARRAAASRFSLLRRRKAVEGPPSVTMAAKEGSEDPHRE